MNRIASLFGTLVLAFSSIWLAQCSAGTVQGCLEDSDCTEQAGQVCELSVHKCMPRTCTPDCSGRECGLDPQNCGTSCGTCKLPEQHCDQTTGRCQACSPGTTQSCTSAEGKQGTQTCQADGTWGSCKVSTCGSFPLTTVRPVELEGVLTNPGIGISTFHYFNGELPLDQYPESTIAYFRLFWKDLEPTEGGFAFEVIDDLIERARSAGQTLAFGLIAADDWDEGRNPPQWLIDKQVEGCWYGASSPTDPQTKFMPAFADPTVMFYSERLIRTLGDRYDSNPSIESVDIGLVGNYGEWHMIGIPCGQMPPLDVQQKYVDWHLEAFPNHLTLSRIFEAQALDYAVKKGAGWCNHGWGATWGTQDEVRNWVVGQVTAGNALDVWKTRPVMFETGVAWESLHGNPQFNLDWWIAFSSSLHLSWFNTNTWHDPIPQDYRQRVDAWLKKIGYRIVVREVAHDSKTCAGETLHVSTRVENVGLAPPYRPYVMAYRLRAKNEDVAAQWPSSALVTSWLPGEYVVEDLLSVPAGLATGIYELDATMMSPSDGKPVVKLAIEGRRGDGWYPFSSLEIVSRQ